MASTFMTTESLHSREHSLHSWPVFSETTWRMHGSRTKIDHSVLSEACLSPCPASASGAALLLSRRLHCDCAERRVLLEGARCSRYSELLPVRSVIDCTS